MSSPGTDWAQYYQHNFPAAGLFTNNQVSDATTVVTTTTTSSASSGLSPEGGVSKPVRRRSRASKRTPTTLLNTDTANFRAMVQQFTGGPLASNTSSYPNGTNFSYGQQIANPNAVMVPRSGYDILRLQQQQQQQQFMFSLNNSDHRVNLRRSTAPQTEVSSDGGFIIDRASSSSKNLSEDIYML